jgi:hypothetical protein
MQRRMLVAGVFLGPWPVRLSRELDSDEVWRERKRQKDEEGAVGYIMMNHISRAK